MSKQKSFFKGALILTIAGVLGKMLGALYRIPFNRIVGEEGAALYGLSYSVYSILFALSTAGVPLAVSKMVAVYEERREHGESIRLLRAAFTLLASIGIVIGLIFFTQSDRIATLLFNEPQAALSLKMLSPAMLFSCLMAVLRGYFQGHQQMVPTAVSQILEQFFRVGTIFLAIFFLAGRPLHVIVAGASFGSAVGGVMGFTFLAIFFAAYYTRRRPKNEVEPAHQESSAAMVKQLVFYAIPISIGALVLPIMQFIDSSMDISRLEASGMAHQQALIQYGYLSSYAMPIINLPFIITTAVAASLVPTVANLHELGDQAGIDRNIRTSLMLTIILMLPAAAGLATLGMPICALLYDNPSSGIALSYVAFTVLAVGVYQVSGSALQGLGHVMVPMTSLIIGAVIKAILNFFLLARPGADIRMAAIATVIGFSVAALHNIYQLGRFAGWRWLSIKQLVVKPAVATLVMAACVTAVKFFFVDLIGRAFLITACGIVVGVVSYFVVLFVIGGIDRETLEKVPKVGPKLASKWGGK
ncbi:MAG: polysaccharide biosynthesis protein [Peptococcaceae bacterium]|nr:polysaccharide biosynthesis protein [Peptococcaceae bacterium]